MHSSDGNSTHRKSLALTPPESGSSVGAILWGREATSHFLFASSEADDGRELTGVHRAVDVNQYKFVYTFSAEETGDAMAVDNDGKCGFNLTYLQAPHTMYQATDWLSLPEGAKKGKETRIFCVSMTSRERMGGIPFLRLNSRLSRLSKRCMQVTQTMALNRGSNTLKARSLARSSALTGFILLLRATITRCTYMTLVIWGGGSSIVFAIKIPTATPLATAVMELLRLSGHPTLTGGAWG